MNHPVGMGLVMAVGSVIRNLIDAGAIEHHPPVEHHFDDDGVYARRMFMAAGLLVVGKRHRYEHDSILEYGSVTVWANGERHTYEGPCTITAPAGTQRIIRAGTDAVWTTYHPNPDNIRDIPTLEAMYVYEEEEPCRTHTSPCSPPRP